MTHDVEKLTRHWLKAAETVRDLLATGQDVLFLVEGDASTYASFCYLARVLRELDAQAQIDSVPGVTSFNAACARLQMPLSEQDDTIAIVPAAYGIAAVEKMLDDFDTLVLMKVKPLLDDLIDLMNRPPVRRPPVAPLRDVDAAEVTLFIRPLVPDAHAVFVQPLHVRVAPEKPQQLVEDRFRVQLLGGQEREAVLQREACLCAEDGVSPRPGAIWLELALFQNEPEQLVILKHGRSVKRET